MLKDGKRYISVNHKREEFEIINIDVYNNDENWIKVVDIFRDRIHERYFRIIDDLIVRNSIIEDGFVIMALNCLLIETLLQFRNGWDETKNGNCNSYSDFLINQFPNEFSSKNLAIDFYKNIRCGILHSAQTKGGSELTEDVKYIIKRIDKKNIRVNVIGFTIMIKAYFDRYISEIMNESESILRENFLIKMRCVCLK